MVNPSKNKGTRAETAVVRYAQTNGFPLAERLALHGSKDIGDIRLAPGLILEVKAGKAAQTASLHQIQKWLQETSTEARNAAADRCALIVQAQGFGVDRVQYWEAWIPNVSIVASPDGEAWHGHPTPVIMVTLDDALHYFRADGYGEPL